MSSTMKFSILALVSSVAAVPHYGHSKFHSHKPSGGYGGPGTGSGAPFPTGNSTAAPFPTGTGALTTDEPTTTLVETLYSTQTIVSTIYATRPGSLGQAPPQSVGVVDVSTGAAVCGPETVYVTATNKVYVTVTPGNAPPASSAPAYTPPVEQPTSEAAPQVPSFSESLAFPSSSAVVEQPSQPAVPVSSAAPSSSPAPVYQPSSEKPVDVPAPTPTPEAPVQVPTSAPIVEKPVSSAAPETPASSAAPVPSAPASAGPGYSGAKRGLAYNDGDLCSAFDGAQFGFAYNWGSTGGDLPSNVGQYIPTCHRPAVITPDQWAADVKTAVSKGSKAVMGFNEPDHAAQANLSPEQACADWKTYMNPIASDYPDVTIIGPSVTNGPPPMGLDWLQRFQTGCPGAVWHACNIHFYDQYDDQVAQRFKDHVSQASEQCGKPVWVTEFGLNPGTASQDQAASFLKDVMSFMDGSNAVQGYSYFMVGTGENQLNGPSGLSPVGKVYVGGS